MSSEGLGSVALVQVVIRQARNLSFSIERIAL